MSTDTWGDFRHSVCTVLYCTCENRACFNGTSAFPHVRLMSDNLYEIRIALVGLFFSFVLAYCLLGENRVDNIV